MLPGFPRRVLRGLVVTCGDPKQPCVAKATIDFAFLKQNQCC